MHPRSRMIAALARPWTLGIAAALVVSLGACFDFDATTAGGPLDDSGVSIVGPDAGFDTGLVTLGDATSPTGTNDATSPVDEDGNGPPPGHEAGAPVDAGHSFCAAYPHAGAGLFFCDDFDEQALPGEWNSFGELEGTLTETDASFVSGPNALDESVLALDAGTVMNVALRTTLAAPPSPSTLKLAFAIQPVQIDPTANAAIVLGAVDFLDTPGNRYTLGLAINVASGAPALALGEQSGFLDGGAPFSNHQLPPTDPLPMNAWSSVVLEIDWTSPTTAEGIVTVNGTKELDVQLTVTVQPSSLQIGVGTSYVSEPSPVWELRYDNVVFTAQ